MEAVLLRNKMKIPEEYLKRFLDDTPDKIPVPFTLALVPSYVSISEINYNKPEEVVFVHPDLLNPLCFVREPIWNDGPLWGRFKPIFAFGNLDRELEDLSLYNKIESAAAFSRVVFDVKKSYDTQLWERTNQFLKEKKKFARNWFILHRFLKYYYQLLTPTFEWKSLFENGRAFLKSCQEQPFIGQLQSQYEIIDKETTNHINYMMLNETSPLWYCKWGDLKEIKTMEKKLVELCSKLQFIEDKKLYVKTLIEEPLQNLKTYTLKYDAVKEAIEYFELNA